MATPKKIKNVKKSKKRVVSRSEDTYDDDFGTDSDYSDDVEEFDDFY